MQPVDYLSGLGGLGALPDPQKDFLGGVQTGMNVDNAVLQQQALKAKIALDTQQQVAAQRQAQIRAATQRAAILNPTIQNLTAYSLAAPEAATAIKGAYEALDKETQQTDLKSMAAIRGYVASGKPERAVTLLQQRIDADKAAGQDTSDDEGLLEAINADPTTARGLIDNHLFAILGPEKFSEAFKAAAETGKIEALLPGEIAKGVAEVEGKVIDNTYKPRMNESSLATAEAQRANIASQIDERADRLDLDRDRLTTNVQLELEKLANKGTTLSAGAEGAMTNAVVAAESSRALSSRAQDLAAEFSKLPAGTGRGSFSGFTEFLKERTGNQNALTQLRQQYDALTITNAIKNLPPGPASDKDIKLTMRGFPSPNADRDTIVSFLNGMAKLQGFAANVEQGRADWISENGNLGRARRDLTVNGVRVPAGSNFSDFAKSAAAVQRREQPQTFSFEDQFGTPTPPAMLKR